MIKIVGNKSGRKIKGYNPDLKYQRLVNQIVSQMASNRGSSALFSVAGSSASKSNLITCDKDDGCRLDFQGRTTSEDYNFQIQHDKITIAAVVVHNNIMKYIIDYRKKHGVGADLDALELGFSRYIGGIFVNSSRDGDIWNASEALRSEEEGEREE